MSKRGRKRRAVRREQQRILVVAEGAVTERQYVELLVQYMRQAGVLVSVKVEGTGKDPRGVVKKCTEFRDKGAARDKGYDKCVCLVDVDNHQTLDSAIELAEKEDVCLLVSNCSFEVWLNWHFSDSLRPVTPKDINKIVEGSESFSRKHLSGKFPISRVKDAVSTSYRADPELKPGRRGPNPSSAMPVLVELLGGES